MNKKAKRKQKLKSIEHDNYRPLWVTSSKQRFRIPQEDLQELEKEKYFSKRSKNGLKIYRKRVEILNQNSEEFMKLKEEMKEDDLKVSTKAAPELQFDDFKGMEIKELEESKKSLFLIFL